MGFADLHLHSIYSRDGSCAIEIILRQAQLRQLDIIAITDHNNMRGVPEALTLMKKYDLQIIPGIEISTANGHLLAYEIYHPLPPRLPLKETVLRIHELGGFCIIPHPMSLGTDAIRHEDLLDTLQHPDAVKTILGIEIINGGFLRRNHLAVGLAEQYQLAPIGNSDGHNINSIGRAVTQFEGNTVQDLKDALRQRQTTPRWHFRTADPLYYPLHTAFHIIRELGYAIGVDESTQQPRLFPVSQLKRRI